MAPNAQNETKESYRGDFRRKLANMFLDEYRLRKDRGELLYEGRWISPSDKFKFIEEMRKVHRSLFLDIVILLALGFIGVIVFIFIVHTFFFPK